MVQHCFPSTVLIFRVPCLFHEEQLVLRGFVQRCFIVAARQLERCPQTLPIWQTTVATAAASWEESPPHRPAFAVFATWIFSRFATAKRHQMCWHTLDTCVCCDLPMEEAMMGFCPASWRASPRHRAWYEAWRTCMGCSSAFRLCMQYVPTVTTTPGNASATPSGDSKTQSCTIFSCSDWKQMNPPRTWASAHGKPNAKQFVVFDAALNTKHSGALNSPHPCYLLPRFDISDEMVRKLCTIINT